MKNFSRLIHFLLREIIFAFIILFFAGCTTRESRQVNEIVSIPVGSLTKYKISDFVKSSELVKLEFTDNSMLGFPFKIERHNNDIIVLDRLGSKSIMIFGPNGTFKNRIGSNGSGPGEFIYPYDFYFNKNNSQLEILAHNKIHVYTTGNEYVVSKNFPFSVNMFHKYNNDKYAFTAGRDEYELLLTDSFLNIRHEHLRKKLSMNTVINQPFTKIDENKFLFRIFLNDTIYLINKKNIFPDKYIDFGDHGLKQKDITELKKSGFNYQVFLDKNKICRISKYAETSEYIQIEYFYQKKHYQYIQNKRSKLFIHFCFDNIDDDLFFNNSCWHFLGSDGEYFVYIIEPYKYKSVELLKKVLKKANISDASLIDNIADNNPLVAFIKYKI